MEKKKTGLDITARRSNTLLGREEIAFEVGAEQATPTRKELRKKVAALTGSDEELVIIGSISQPFGSKTARCDARIYKSNAMLEKTEAKYMVNRNRGIKKANEKDGAAQDRGAEPAVGDAAPATEHAQKEEKAAPEPEETGKGAES